MKNSIRRPLIKIFSLAAVISLLLCFPTEKTAAKAPSPDLRPALMLHPVVTEKENGCELLLKTFQPLEEYTAFLLKSPERLVVDIKNVDFDGKFEKLINGCSWPGAIQIGRHQEKTRIVFHLPQGIEIRHRVEQKNEGLKISIDKTSSSVEEKKVAANEQQAAVLRHDTSSSTSDDIRQLVEMELPDKKISMSFFKSPVSDFFSWAAAESGRGIDVDPDVNAPLTMNLQNTSLHEGVLAVLTIYKLGMEKRGDRLHVYRLKQ